MPIEKEKKKTKKFYGGESNASRYLLEALNVFLQANIFFPLALVFG